jgi:hypothetical protein
MGSTVDLRSYLPKKGLFIGAPGQYAKPTRTDYEAVVVLDIGYLDGKKVKKLFPQTPLVLFAGDTPQALGGDTFPNVVISITRRIFGLSSNKYLRKIGLLKSSKYYDATLSSDPRAVESFKKNNPESHWFPYWSQQEKEDYTRAADCENDYDLVTVMTPRPERLPLLEGLKQTKDLNFYHASNVQQATINGIYRSSLAVLNHSSFGEVTIRFFEAFASGRVIVTNKLDVNSGLKEMFEAGKHYHEYDSLSELLEIMEYIKKNRSQILENGLNAQEIIYEKHLAIHRSKTLLEILERIV